MTTQKTDVWNRKTDKDKFIRAYIECALWSTTNENCDMGSGLDALFDLDNLSDDLFNSMVQNCESFLFNFNDTLIRLEQMHSYGFEQAGHDFWLSHNGHGAGFFDRDALRDTETLEKFEAHCETVKELNLYENEGVIYGD